MRVLTFTSFVSCLFVVVMVCNLCLVCWCNWLLHKARINSYVGRVLMIVTMCCMSRMIARLQHWLRVFPPVEGSDVKLPTQLCTGVDMLSLRSHTDNLQVSSSTDAVAKHQDAVAMEASDASAVQQCLGDSCSEAVQLPDFPLLPLSRGFHMKLQKLLCQFETTLVAAGIASGSS